MWFVRLHIHKGDLDLLKSDWSQESNFIVITELGLTTNMKGIITLSKGETKQIVKVFSSSIFQNMKVIAPNPWIKTEGMNGVFATSNHNLGVEELSISIPWLNPFLSRFLKPNNLLLLKDLPIFGLDISFKKKDVNS